MPEEPQRQIQVILPHLSRWRSLKQFLPTVLWFIAGVVLSVLSDVVLFPLWWESGGHRILVRASWQVNRSAKLLPPASSNWCAPGAPFETPEGWKMVAPG